MDIYRINSDLKYVNRLGETLSTEEKVYLEVGLLRLMENEPLDQLLFWGRIRGHPKDYYIAVGLKFQNEYEFPTKRFYWATTGNFYFTPLPYLINEHAEHAENKREFFTGEPTKIVWQKQAADENDAPPQDKLYQSLN